MKTLSNYISEKLYHQQVDEKLIINKHFNKSDDLDDLISKLDNINDKRSIDSENAFGFQTNGKNCDDITLVYIWKSLINAGIETDLQTAYDDILNGESMIVYAEEDEQYYAAVQVMFKIPVNKISKNYPFFSLIFFIDDDTWLHVIASLCDNIKSIEGRIIKAYKVDDIDSIKKLLKFLLKNNNNYIGTFTTDDFEKIINKLE